MKKLSTLLLVAIIAFASCNQQEDKTEFSQEDFLATESSKLNEFLKKFEEPSQSFHATSNKRILIKCNQGTNIVIDPSDLVTENGDAIGSNIDIEVKELFNQRQFVSAGVQTISDGNLLVSGGALYISVTSDGQKLKLKEGKTYSVQLPKLSEEEMGLFYGQFDNTNGMNWKQADQVFVLPRRPDMDTTSGGDRNSDSGYEVIVVTGTGKFRDTVRSTMKNLSSEQITKLEHETEMAGKVYAPIDLKKFGWINCDYFYKYDAPGTNVQFTITNNAEEVNYIKVYMVFKDINSVMQSSYYIWNNKIEKSDFNNIPVDMSVRFFGVGYQHGKIFATLTSETKITSNHDEKLTLKEMNEQEFKNLIESL